MTLPSLALPLFCRLAELGLVVTGQRLEPDRAGLQDRRGRPVLVSSTRKDFSWNNSHHVAGDLRTGVQKLKDRFVTNPVRRAC